MSTSTSPLPKANGIATSEEKIFSPLHGVINTRAPLSSLASRYSHTLQILKKSTLTSKVKQCLRIDTQSKHRTVNVDWKPIADEFKSLGANVQTTLEDRRYIAKESDDAKTIGVAVYQAIAKKLSPAEAKDKNSQTDVICVSFITTHIQHSYKPVEKQCFISYSRSAKTSYQEKYDLLEKALKKYLTDHATMAGYTLTVLPPVSRQYHDFLHHVADVLETPFNPGTLCAEISFHATLSKLFFKFGNAFSIEGIVNLPIPIITTKLPVSPTNLAKWNGGNADWQQGIDHIPHWICCDSCQNNMSMYLLVWTSMQQLGEQHKIKAAAIEPVSPLPEDLRNNTKTFQEVDSNLYSIKKAKVKLKQVIEGLKLDSQSSAQAQLRLAITYRVQTQSLLISLIRLQEMQIENAAFPQLKQDIESEVADIKAMLDYLNQSIAKLSPLAQAQKQIIIKQRRDSSKENSPPLAASHPNRLFSAQAPPPKKAAAPDSQAMRMR